MQIKMNNAKNVNIKILLIQYFYFINKIFLFYNTK
jgi:hypothetical protein